MIGGGALAGRLNLAIATGESKCTRYHFRELLKSGGVHIILPDIGRAGGISETLKIAHLADAFHVQFSPHISSGSAIYRLASFQLSAAVSNLAVVEGWVGVNPLNQIISPPVAMDQGIITVPDGPGLGVQIHDERFEQYVLRDE